LVLDCVSSNGGNMAKNKPEATGYSATFNFTEAFQNAVNSLPPPMPQRPDPGKKYRGGVHRRLQGRYEAGEGVIRDRSS
jgi:hypothetical protein